MPNEVRIQLHEMNMDNIIFMEEIDKRLAEEKPVVLVTLSDGKVTLGRLENIFYSGKDDKRYRDLQVRVEGPERYILDNQISRVYFVLIWPIEYS